MSASATVVQATATWGAGAQVTPSEQASLQPEVEVSDDGKEAIASWMTRGTGAFLTPDGSYLRPEAASASRS